MAMRVLTHPWGKLLRGGSRLRLAAALASLISIAGYAQADFEKGFQNYQAFHGSEFDPINLANGNLALDIPLLTYEQRGNLPPITISIRSNSTTFQSTPPFQGGPPDTAQYEVPSGVIGAPFGQPHVVISPGGTSWKEERINMNAHLPSQQPEYLSRFVAIDDSGATHSLGGGIANTAQGEASWLMYSVDGSGLMLQNGAAPIGPMLVDRNGNIGSLTDTVGNTVTMSGQCARPAGSGDYYDPSLGPWQGYAHGVASAVSITDSIGRVIPNPSYVPPVYSYSCAVDLFASYHPAHPDASGCETWNFPAQQGTNSPSPLGTIPLTFCYSQHPVTTSLPMPASVGTSPPIGGSTYACNPVPLGAVNVVSCETVNETWWLLDKVVLPNQTTWQFTYNTNGQVQSLTMPTGATITYSYKTRISCGNPPGEIPVSGAPTWPYSNLMSSQMVTKRVLNVNDGSSPSEWDYLSTVGSGWVGSPNSGYVVVTDPNLNDTVHTFSLIGQSVCGPYETSAQYYQGKSPQNPATSTVGALIKSASTTYTYTGLDNANPTNFSNYIEIGVLPNIETTTLANGITKQTSSEYDTFGTYQDYKGTVYPFSFGLIRRAKEWDWSNGPIVSGVPPMRTTLNTHLWESNLNYYTGNFIDLPCLQTVVAGDSTGAIPACGSIGTVPGQIAQTLYGYDESAQDNYQGTHGLQTSVTHWVGSGSSPVITKTVYNTTVNPWGMPAQKIDGRGLATSFTYDSTGLHLSRTDYPSTTAYGVTVPHFNIPHYDQWTGLLLSNEDENSQTTSYQYDVMRRLKQINFPDGGWETYTYNDAAPAAYQQSAASPAAAFTFTKLLDSNVGTTYTAQGVVDELGRNRKTEIAAPGNLTIYKDTFYDLLSRVASETNPYFTTTDSTYGVTSYSYDALNRKYSATLPDGATLHWCFDGFSDAAVGIVSTYCHTNQNASLGGDWVDATDQLGHVTQSSMDGLGHLRAVYDANHVSTTYGYDVMGNLLSVSQPGASGETARGTRTFTYDGLSRLITAYNPETGTVCYGSQSSGCISAYDGNNNLLTKTDARGVISNYTYDEANRLVAKSYSNDASGTAASCYQYDASTLASTGANLSSHLTNAWTQKSACGTTSAAPNFTTGAGVLTRHSILAYDAMGRALSEQQCTVTNCSSGSFYTPSYAYDVGGNLIHYANGIASGTGAMQFTTAYDIANRVSSVSRDPATPNAQPFNLFTSPAYTASGALTAALYGGYLNLARAYDKRLRIVGEMDTSGGATDPQPATAGTATIKIFGQEQTH